MLRDQARAFLKWIGTASRREVTKSPLMSTLTVLGLILAIYFYVEGRRERELVFFVHPAKPILMRGIESNLTVSYLGEQVEGEVRMVDVSFVNYGDDVIRDVNMLQPLRIRASDGVRMLDARVRYASRDVVSITPSRNASQPDSVELTWNILERGDGGVIQLILAGGSEGKLVEVDAVVEGQGQATGRFLTGKLISPLDDYRSTRSNSLFVGLATVFTGIMMASMFHRLLRHNESDERLEQYIKGAQRADLLNPITLLYVSNPVTRLAIKLVAFLYALVLVSMGISLLLARAPLPPFGL